ncbi:MAG: winged helix-turn-helix domain-containing protein, partial [Achromobacter sp.]
ILLDLGLPDGRGEDLLAAWRTRAVPIIVVSAREDEAGKIALLDAGADDYLVKPFGVGELLARMRVALRHRGTSISPAQTTYELEGLSVDLTTHRVTRDGVEIKLTATEFKLLARLVQKAGQVVTHRQLLIDVWGAEYAEHTHYVRVYMGNLRAKLERDPTDPRYVRTEVGVGYRLAVE